MLPSWISRCKGWIVGLAVLAVACGFFLFSWIDALVTADYASQTIKYQREQIEVLRSLALETGKRMKRSEIRELVMRRFKAKHLIKEQKQNELSIDSVVLEFRGDLLVEITVQGD